MKKWPEHAARLGEINMILKEISRDGMDWVHMLSVRTGGGQL